MRNTFKLLGLSLSFITLCSSTIACGSKKDANWDLPKDKNWDLVFEDNFDGTELNTSLWEQCPEWDRQDRSKWSNSASYVDGNGNLVLDMLPNPDNPDRILTGAVRTYKKFEQAFGYFEANIKFPVLKGTWGAFWLMGDTVANIDGSGRDGTEIDIIETINNNRNKVNHALHWDGYGDEHKSQGKEMTSASIYDGEFHKFGLYWTEDEYVFYIDGEETWRTDAGGVCQNPLYMKLSVEAASWTGNVDKSKLPQQMLVDYVKVYKEKE